MSYTQNAKFEYRLVPTEIDLTGLAATEKVVALPSGAQVMQVNVEVVEVSDSGATLDIGLDSENTFFSTGVALDTLGNTQSSKVTATKQSSLVTITPSTALTKGKIVVRVAFFHPSDKKEEIAD